MTSASLPGPEKFCFGRGPTTEPMPPAVKAWIRRETAQQLSSYYAIAKEIAGLAPMRDQWAREFDERITGPRGFSVHAGNDVPFARTSCRRDRSGPGACSGRVCPRCPPAEPRERSR